MNTTFDYFTLSIFMDCDVESLTEKLLNFPYYKEDIPDNKVFVYKDQLQIERYFNPAPGGAHFEQFSWWSSRRYPNIVFLCSNMSDGLSGTSNHLRKALNCTLIRIRMSTPSVNEPGCFWFQYTSSDGKERIIYALQEDRWVFYETGEPLSFENLDYYKRRIIKKRINNEIIIEYLSKCGINLYDINAEVDQCMTLERKAWNNPGCYEVSSFDPTEVKFITCYLPASETTIKIPSRISTLKPVSFEGCANITSIVVEGDTPPAIADSTFAVIDKKSCVLHIPKGSKEAYRNAKYWNEFQHVVEME